MLDAIVSSNICRTLALCSLASILSLYRYNFRLVVYICLGCSALIWFSFIFDVGEVYSYSDIYKRGFWYLGDDVTTWLTPFFIYCLLAKKHTSSCIIAAAIFMSGGRIGILLLLIQSIVICLNQKNDWQVAARAISIRLAMGLGFYFLAVSASPYAISIGNKLALSAGMEHNLFERSRGGYSDCREGGDCLENKIKRPFRMRAFSAIAGIWMTLDGGYPGDRFPNTPEKFAELMMDANPWGINDTYALKKADWEQIGTIQSAYPQFGAGYGPLALATVMLFIGMVCVAGISNLRHCPSNASSAFTVFFIVNAMFNHTQPWLLPGPILFFMALAGGLILYQFWLSRADASGTPNEALAE